MVVSIEVSVGVLVMKMDLREILLVFTMLWEISSCLRCYKCKPQIEDYRDRACEHFDYSDQYLTECDGSSMCYKREITSSLGNGLKLYERDCAHQILIGDQVLTDHKWEHVKRIYEVYEEGCTESESHADRVTKTVNCYCRGDLCNSAGIVKTNGVFLISLLAGLLIGNRI